jgi:hypothetical protein
MSWTPLTRKPTLQTENKKEMKKHFLIMCLSLIATGQALSQITPVNIGSSANSGGGDALRTWAIKYNQADFTLDQKGTASGTDTYTVTIAAPSPGFTTGISALSAYTTGLRFWITFTNANTGAATLNINGLGAKSIVKNGSIALSSGDISAGQTLCLAYDGTNLQIIGSSVAGVVTLTGTQTLTNKTLTSPAITTPTGIVKGDVGLGNVDNTSDANKPVSTATQTALDAKQATLVSGTNIKTINGTSVLGSGDITVSAGTWGSITGTLSSQTDLQTALDAKVAKETFTSLVDGATVAWDQSNKQSPLAKLTSTQSFTINITNVKDGASGILKLTKNTASDIVMTFDTDFTNKSLNSTLTTYTFSGSSGNQYFLSFVVDGTAIEWVIGDVVSSTAPPAARVTKTTAQSIANNTYTALTWGTQVFDNGALWDSGNASRFTIPGSGDKMVTVSFNIWFASNSTGLRRCGVIINGGAGASSEYIDARPPTSGAITYIHDSFTVYCQGGDYLEVFVFQSSGGALDVAGSGTQNNCSVIVHDL